MSSDSDDDVVTVYHNTRRRSRRSAIPSPSSSSTPPRRRRRAVLDTDTLILSPEREPIEPVQPTTSTHPGVVESSDEDDVVVKKKSKPSVSEIKKEPVIDDDEDADCCTVCFEEFVTVGNHRLSSLKCGHFFGEACINRWIRTEKSASCPVCKKKARLADVRVHFAKSIKVKDTSEFEEMRERHERVEKENEALRLELAEKRQEIAALKKLVNNKQSIQKSVVLESVTLGVRLRLVQGQRLEISTDDSLRGMDFSGQYLAVPCRIDANLFKPYGIRLLTPNLQPFRTTALHMRPVRFIAASPFESEVFLSTSQDRRLCVTYVGETQQIRHSFDLPMPGWCCCWISATVVCVGLQSGPILKLDLDDPSAAPVDITNGGGKMPVNDIAFIDSLNCVVATTARRVTAYREGPTVLYSEDDLASRIVGFAINSASRTFMVSSAPPSRSDVVVHRLFSVELRNGSVHSTCTSQWLSHSHVAERIIRPSLWNYEGSLHCAVFDEEHLRLVIHDWSNSHPDVMLHMREVPLVVRVIPTVPPSPVTIAMLTEKAIYTAKLISSPVV